MLNYRPPGQASGGVHGIPQTAQGNAPTNYWVLWAPLPGEILRWRGDPWRALWKTTWGINRAITHCPVTLINTRVLCAHQPTVISGAAWIFNFALPTKALILHQRGQLIFPFSDRKYVSSNQDLQRMFLAERLYKKQKCLNQLSSRMRLIWLLLIVTLLLQ